jgi:hypothetical protein
MATELTFTSTERSDLHDASLVVYQNCYNEIFIKISGYDEISCICLDKETAKKLAKEIRKQISFLED